MITWKVYIKKLEEARKRMVVENMDDMTMGIFKDEIEIAQKAMRNKISPEDFLQISINEACSKATKLLEFNDISEYKLYLVNFIIKLSTRNKILDKR